MMYLLLLNRDLIPRFSKVTKNIFFFPTFCAVFQFRLMLDMFVCTQGNQIMATISDRPRQIDGCFTVLAVQAAYCEPMITVVDKHNW